MPRKRSERYNIEYMIAQIEEYIEKNTGITAVCDEDGNVVKHTWGVPVYEECLMANKWSKTRVFELRRESKELDEACERLKTWKAIRLEKGALYGFLEKTMSIFLLKQLGYRENVESDRVIRVELEGVEDLAE